jgi:hypothetical protein
MTPVKLMGPPRTTTRFERIARTRTYGARKGAKA